MLQLSRFMSVPFLYKNRKPPNLRNIILTDCTPGGENTSGFIISFRILSDKRKTVYDADIYVDTDDTIHMNTPCKFKCNCSSFKYEFETMLHQNGSLIGEPSSKRLPKKQTGVYVCKHLVSCIILLTRFNDIATIQKQLNMKRRP